MTTTEARVGAAKDGDLRLRTATSADRELLINWFLDPAVSIPWAGVEFSRQELEKRFADLRAPDCGRGDYIAEERDHPVGYLAYDAGLGDAYVHIALAPEARGRGLGRRALRLFSDLLLANGCSVVMASPSPENLPIIRALEGAGFRRRDAGWALMQRTRDHETPGNR